MLNGARTSPQRISVELHWAATMWSRGTQLDEHALPASFFPGIQHEIAETSQRRKTNAKDVNNPCAQSVSALGYSKLQIQLLSSLL